MLFIYKISDKIKVQIQTNTRKPKLYFKVIFVHVDSFPCCPTAAVAMAIDCGDTSLAITPPTVFAATSNVELVDKAAPAVA